MRIAFFSWEALHGIALTSVATHVGELARALVRNGHEVHLITRRGEGQGEHSVEEGVHYHRPGFDLLPNLVDEVQNMCRAFVATLDRIETKHGPCDIIHAHDWTCANAGAWAMDDSSRRGRLVFSLHSIESARCGSESLSGDSERIAAHEQNGCNRAERVITVSHSLRREVMDIYGVPEWQSEVIYNGVDLQRFSGTIDAGEVKTRHAIAPLEPVILFSGHLEYRLGPDLLLRAMPEILSAHPQARLLVAGKGPMRDELQGMAAHLGLEHAVRFANGDNPAERRDMYRAADIVCVPSRNDPCSMAVLEAWAAGKPVVVTQDGGPGEYVWHDVNGVHVHESPDSIAWGVGHLFRDFQWARWVGANGRTAAETAFTWSLAANHVQEVYERLENVKNR